VRGKEHAACNASVKVPVLARSDSAKFFDSTFRQGPPAGLDKEFTGGGYLG